MEESMTEDHLANAVLVVENDDLEWDDKSITILGIPEAESIEDLTQATAGLVIDKETPEENSSDALFENLKILEIIITRVLYYDHPNKPIQFRHTIQQLRLVSKKFLEAVTQTLRNENDILFYLTLDKTNSLSDAPLVQESGKCLNKFLKWLYSSDSPSWYKEHHPLFSLKITEEFFTSENYNSLLDCLLKCGEDLQKLEIFLPETGSTFWCKSSFPSYILPALEELIIYLGARINETAITYPNNSMLLSYNDNIYLLINSLLVASSKLKRLKLDNRKTNNFSGILSFSEFFLPPSIVKLELYLIMVTSELELLLKNPLPSLTSLRFTLPKGTTYQPRVYNLLDAFSITLQELEIVELEELNPKQEYKCCTYQLKFPIFRFPKMEKLKSLELKAFKFDLLANASLVSSNFPALERIHLIPTEAEFHKWTKCSVYDGVHTVLFELGDDRYNSCTISISRANMMLLHSTFPNMTRLTLKMTDDFPDGLQYTFREIRKLKYLKLDVFDTSYVWHKKTKYWDALLLGVTEECLKNIKNSPEINVETCLEKKDAASICMLTELEELHLGTVSSWPSNTALEDVSLISDWAFLHAFIKMPKLCKLGLEGRFKASDKMRNMWENQYNRCIHHTQGNESMILS